MIRTLLTQYCVCHYLLVLVLIISWKISIVIINEAESIQIIEAIIYNFKTKEFEICLCFKIFFPSLVCT